MEERQRQEIRLIRIIEGNLNEDSYVDRKLDLPTSDPHKNARKIAGLCNSARGAEALWVLGIEDNGTLHGVGKVELSNWWPQVTKHFEEAVPEMTDLSVSYDGMTFHGLFFRSDRAPYVVRVAQSNPDLLEVPWRAGTGTRSARRSELFRLLSSTTKLPQAEVAELELYVRNDGEMNNGSRSTADGFEEQRWSVTATGKIFVESTEPFTIAIHRTSLNLMIPFAGFGRIDGRLRFWSSGSDPAVNETQYAVRVSYPTMLEIRSSTSLYLPKDHDPAPTAAQDASFVLRLGITGSDVPLSLQQPLKYLGTRTVPGPPSRKPEYVWELE